MFRTLPAVSLLSLCLMISGCKTNNTPNHPSNTGNYRAPYPAPEPLKPVVDTAPFRAEVKKAEDKLKEGDVTFTSLGFEEKIQYPKDPANPETQMEALAAYVKATDNLISAQSDESSRVRRNLAQNLLDKWKRTYTPEVLARMKSEAAERNRVAEIERKKTEENAGKARELITKVQALEKDLDDLGLAFQVKKEWNGTSVALSALPAAAKDKKVEENFFLHVILKTDEYHNTVGELLALKAGLTEDERTAYLLKQKVNFKLGAALVKRTSQTITESTEAGLAKLGILRKVARMAGGNQFAFYDLKHFSATKAVSPDEIKKNLSTMESFYRQTAKFFPISKLTDNKDFDTELKSPFSAGLPKIGEQKPSFSAEHRDLLDGSFASAQSQLADNAKALSAAIKDGATREELGEVLASLNRDSVLKSIAFSDAVLKKKMGVTFKVSPKEVLEVDQDERLAFQKANRFTEQNDFEVVGNAYALLEAYQAQNALVRILTASQAKATDDEVARAKQKAAAIKAFGEGYLISAAVADKNDFALKRLKEKGFKDQLPSGFEQ